MRRDAAFSLSGITLGLCLLVSCAPAQEDEPPLLVVDVGGGETLDLSDKSSGTIIVLNQGGGTLTWTASCSGTDAKTGHEWLSCSKISGSVNTTADRVDLTVSRGNLASGEYSGEVAFSSNGGSARVVIRMLVESNTVSFSVAPESLEFGDLNTNQEKSLTISGVGRGMAAWSLSPSSETTWISVSPMSGSLEAPGSVQVIVTAKPSMASKYGAVSGFLRLVGGDDIINIPVRATVVADCDKDADCSLANSYCNTITQQCSAQKELGSDCVSDVQCRNNNSDVTKGFCVDGICCESACDEVCFECREGGICTQLDSGSSDPACGTTSVCNPGTCTPDARCLKTTMGYPCDQDDPCSACDGAGTCTDDVLVSGYCRIDGECLESGEAKTGYPCMTCNPEVDLANWTPRPEGVVCDDGDWCTNPDVCDSDGICTTAPRTWSPDGESVLDDNIGCTIDSCDSDLMAFEHEPVASLCSPRPCKTNVRCDSLSGCLYDTAPVESDGYACTVDTCDSATGLAVHAPDDSLCADTRFCTTNERCQPDNPVHDERGCVWDITAVSDGIDCTDDICDVESDSKLFVPDDSFCQAVDDSYCRINKHCDKSLGCVSDPRPVEDGFSCTIDSCDEVNNTLVHSPDNNLCSDSRFCTTNERCSPASASRDSRGCIFDVTTVSDLVDCTLDTCDLSTDKAVYTPVDSRCVDDQFCTVNERCDSALGCLTDLKNVDDGFSCTIDSCDEVNDTVIHSPDNSLCSDSRFCTTNERCSPASASRDSRGCIFDVTPVTDFIDCTTDSCNLTTDSAEFAADNSKCADSDYCTVNERCDVDQGCLSDNRFVDDGIACTDDSCDSISSAIRHIPNDSLCTDNLSCTINAHCDATSGCLSSVPPTNDGVACTVDGCSEPAGVYHTPDASRCEQKECADVVCDPSTTGSGCVYTPKSGRCLIDGVCRANGDRNPANQCQFCSPDVSQTAWSMVAAGTSCDDGQVCTWGDKCAGGVCVGTPHLNGCDDGLACTVDTCNPDGTCGHGISDGWCVIQDLGCIASGTLTESTCMTCDPLRSKISWSTTREGLTCNDNDACTSGDHCSVGTCVGSAVSCNDGLACTADGCDHQTGCTNELLDDFCLIDGVCYAENVQNLTNECEGCVTTVNTTTWSPVREGLECDDLIACTHTDACVLGTCTGTSYVCDDHVSCTNNVCDGTGGCSYPVSAGKCLIDDRCYSEGDLEPTNECRECRSAVTKTAWTADNTNTCSDNQNCTMDDHCQSGTCVGTTYTCDDDLECTLDTCLGDGTCTNELLDGYCLINGACYADGESNPLNECEICHTDTDVADWVAYDSVFSPTKYCDDGNEYTQGEYCAFGQCLGAGRVADMNTDFCTDSSAILYSYSGIISCPIPGESYFGQDGNYLRHPVEIVSESSMANVYVDTVSGLLILLNSSAARDQSDAESFCSSLTLGGLVWRLPTVFEAFSLVTRSSASDHLLLEIDNTSTFYFWTSLPIVTSASESWVVGSKVSTLDRVFPQVNGETNSRTMCVSGGFTGQPDYALNDLSTTVTTYGRNLVWQAQSSASKMTWISALSYCESLDLAGHKDWRLPSVKELLTLVDYSSVSPSAFIQHFPDTKSDYYISSSTITYKSAPNDSRIWNAAGLIRFSNGVLRSVRKDSGDMGYVRCVRSVCPPGGICPSKY